MYGIAAVAAAGLLARSKRAPTKRASRVACAAGSVSVNEVKEAQAGWANAIRTISKTYLDGGDYVAAAAAAAGELYGYGHGNVLFKPTKAKDVQFRPRPPKPCPISLELMPVVQEALLRIMVSPSTVARVGPM